MSTARLATRSLLAPICLLLAAVAAPLAAGPGSRIPAPVMIDFDLLPPGTVVHDQYPDVKFSTELDVEIQTADVFFAPSPPNIICTVPVFGGATCANEVRLTFAQPVFQLHFEAVGAKDVGTVAEVAIYQFFDPTPSAVIPIVQTIPGGTSPIFVDLSTFTDVTEIKVFNVIDPAGVGYDNFYFELLGPEIFLDGFESGDTSFWSATVTGPPAELKVAAPPSIAGDYPAGDADFGAPLDPLGVSGFLEYVDDGDDQGGAGSIRDACQPVSTLPTGAIALIDLGPCDFSTQVLNAQNAGAMGAVVVNTLDDDIFTMLDGAAGPSVFISSLLIGDSDGDLIKTELGVPISVTLRTPTGGVRSGER